MEFKINLPIKEGDTIYTIENCKIEKYFVEKISFHEKLKSPYSDISHNIKLHLNRYNNGVDYYQKNIPLSLCFLSKKDLINQLDK